MRLVAFAAFVALALAACSSSTASDGGGSSGGIAYPVNGCSEADFAANDHTAEDDPRIIQGPNGATPAQYSPRCMRVRAGQEVTFRGDISAHPVDFSVVPGNPQPFPTRTSKRADGGATFDTLVLTIERPDGVLRFACPSHPDVMFGAIQTVP